MIFTTVLSTSMMKRTAQFAYGTKFETKKSKNQGT